MKLSVLFLILTLVATSLAVRRRRILPNKRKSAEIKYIANINKVQSSWKAGRNFPKGTSIKDVKRLLERVNNGDRHQLAQFQNSSYLEIPEEFDARIYWKNCPTIGEIRDQGRCASGWALAGVQAMSDRVCIHSNGTKQILLSAQEVVSCSQIDDDGCVDGSPDKPWLYWVDKGIVSGGGYNSHQGCYSYEFEPYQQVNFNRSRPAYRSKDLFIPNYCKKTCEPNSTFDFEKDKQFGKIAYEVPSDEESIQREIMTNGPVAAFFYVYKDFIYYTSGVYRHVSNYLIGGLTTKILGWGIQDGNPYWLCANSWNLKWGDNGYFKILRGFNESGIEDQVVAGLPNF